VSKGDGDTGLRMGGLAIEVGSYLKKQSESGKVPSWLVEELEKCLNTVIASISNCDFYDVGLGIGYLALLISELMDVVDNRIVRLKLAELYTLVAMTLGKAVEVCSSRDTGKEERHQG